MFANFIEETCTGTTTDLTLAGATTGKISVQKAFANGALISYVVEDANGNKCSGVGTYQTTGNLILRPAATDNWTWDGTTYTANPAANLTLSAGTHKVRCTLTADTANKTATTGANNFTAAQEWATGANIASAATINLDNATGNRVHITGTTTITAVTLTRGPRTVIFDGVLTLTHNATTNNLPGAANITTAAGDRAVYESDGTTVYCVAYMRKDGTPVVAGSSGAWVHLSTVTAINSATVDIETTFDGTYDTYAIVATGITASNATQNIIARMKIGRAYISSTTYAYHAQYSTSSSATYAATSATGDTSLFIGYNSGTAAGDHANFYMHIYSPASTSLRKCADWKGMIIGATATAVIDGAGINTATAALTGVRFSYTTGNIASGTFRLYGIKNS